MKFHIAKLGCPKNDVDADYLAARLIADGHQFAAEPESADAILVNTCGFILPAKEESIHELLRLCQLKKTGQAKKVFATGCLSQRHGDELLAGMPELDGAFGLGELDAIANAVNKPAPIRKTVSTDALQMSYVDYHERYVGDSLPYAYLKISDGCDRRCAYCAIPDIRGGFRSRPKEAIVKEAESLAHQGKKELILVSQDATVYGRDIQSTLIRLLEQLDTIDPVKWIRLLYLHPAGLSEELITYMTDGHKTLPYFDIPLQHINNEILSSMRRVVDRPRVEYLLKTIRTASTKATIRTTFIVGLPGETQDRFAELLNFVKDQRFDRMGVFVFSPEEGTAAAKMTGQVSTEVKYRRMDEIMLLQQEMAFAKNNSLIGHRRDVIIDAINADGSAVGRTDADCPDIDQEVFVTGAGPRVGDILNIRITGSREYDLEGTVVEG